MDGKIIRLIPIEEEPLQKEKKACCGFGELAAIAAAVAAAAGVFCFVWKKLVK